jgi:hypothetical protein
MPAGDPDDAVTDAPDAGRVVSLGRLYRDTWRTYRERFRRVAGTAVVILVPLTAVDLVVQSVAASLREDYARSFVLVSAVLLAADAMALTAGFTLYAGVLDKTVGGHLYGHPDLTIPQVLRALPWRTLLFADVVFALVVAALFAVALVPGIVFATFFIFIGPIINIEGHTSVRRAFRRSFALVRPHFWLTLVAVVAPLVAEQFLHDVVFHLEVIQGLPGHLLVAALFNLTIVSFIGLVEVVLAFELIEEDRPEWIHDHGSGHETGHETDPGHDPGAED